jgi:hypothetical protein
MDLRAYGGSTYILVTEPEELLLVIECDGTGRYGELVERGGINHNAVELRDNFEVNNQVPG